MGQALRRARGAAVRFAEEKSAPTEAARQAVATEDSDRPIVLYSAGVRRVKTKEQLETEARWAAKGRALYGDPKSPPSPKSRLRSQEKQTDYKPDPPYDQPYDQPYSQPFPGHQPIDRAAYDREWDQSDPNYKFMVQKAAAGVVSRTETVGGPGASAPKPSPMRLSRTKVDDTERERRIVPGKLNILQLRQAYLLANDPVKKLDVEAIAEKFEVKAEQLKLLFKHTSLAQGRPVDKSVFRGVAKPSK